MKSYSDVAIAEDIDGIVMEVVSATSNILLPFEMVRKAIGLENHSDSSSKDGLKAIDTVLQHLRNAGKNALLSNFGDEAKNILSRAAAPGITMTSEGYYVPGVLDNRYIYIYISLFFLFCFYCYCCFDDSDYCDSSAETVAKSMQEANVKEFFQEDVLELLKGVSPKISSKDLMIQSGADRLKVIILIS